MYKPMQKDKPYVFKENNVYLSNDKLKMKVREFYQSHAKVSHGSEGYHEVSPHIDSTSETLAIIFNLEYSGLSQITLGIPHALEDLTINDAFSEIISEQLHNHQPLMTGLDIISQKKLQENYSTLQKRFADGGYTAVFSVGAISVRLLERERCQNLKDHPEELPPPASATIKP